ncbi:MAG: DUF4199 domain-containing protein [Reichenbachiella sp.]|uniref:DUF4199 domain-containing protein n=1 Tax=Reichenbachiella sp. TaxID=2184521 RepID=UPI0032630364
MKNLAFKYGIISSAVMCTMVVIPLFIWETPAENKYGEVLGYAAMILALTAIYFGIKEYKTELEGELSFKQAFIFGTFVNFVAALAFGIFSYALYAWLMPDFLQQYLDHSIAKVMTDTSLTESERATQIKFINDREDFFLSPALGGLLMFGTVFPIGLVMTLISSFALKSK